MDPELYINSLSGLDKREEFDIQFINCVKLRNQRPTQLNENPRNSHFSKCAYKKAPMY